MTPMDVEEFNQLTTEALPHASSQWWEDFEWYFRVFREARETVLHTNGGHMGALMIARENLGNHLGRLLHDEVDRKNGES